MGWNMTVTVGQTFTMRYHALLFQWMIGPPPLIDLLQYKSPVILQTNPSVAPAAPHDLSPPGVCPYINECIPSTSCFILQVPGRSSWSH